MTVPPFPLVATAYALPFVRPFRGLEQRQGMVIEGPQGWGEFAPFADYSGAADARWLVAAIEAALDGAPGDGSPVASNAILADPAEADLDEAVQGLLARTGCTTLKVKIGGRSTGAELARISRVHRAGVSVSPGLRLRLDGNGRFGFADAQELLAALVWSDIDVDYVEQPCQTVTELRLLKQQFPQVRLAADEALRRDRVFDQVSEFADVAIVKIGPLGGGRAVRRLVAGLDVDIVVSGAAESSVGLSRDAVAALSIGEPQGVHGLGTGALLADDLVAETLVPRNGCVAARRQQVDSAALRRAADRVSVPGAQEWQDRLAAAWALLVADGLLSAEELAEMGVMV